MVSHNTGLLLCKALVHAQAKLEASGEKPIDNVHRDDRGSLSVSQHRAYTAVS